MKVESESATGRPPVVRTKSTATGRSPAESLGSSVASVALSMLPTSSSARFVACAPGRLDLMGGLADYSGALVVNKTIDAHVAAAVERRTDGKLQILLSPSLVSERGGLVIPLGRLNELKHVGSDLSSDNGRAAVRSEPIRCLTAAVAEWLPCSSARRLEGGLTIAVDSSLEEFSDAGRDAALAAATVTAVSAAYGESLSLDCASSICERVENQWLGRGVGRGDSAGILGGHPSSVMLWRTDAIAEVGKLSLASGIAVIGIDSGVCPEDATDKRCRVRAAVLMGRQLIDAIVRHEGAGSIPWDGHLSRVSIDDYVTRFRDRLPTRLKGGEYLQRFGETNDPNTRVEPEFTYKIRSRTEHHIYEHHRSCQFSDCLRQAASGDELALLEAGKVMYASHWSYGQRCGLGSVQTDALVTLIRRQGPKEGLFGAKITGRGCGGTVAVLMRDDQRARDALDEIMGEYRLRTGRKATLVTGSRCGALVGGARVC